MKYLQRELVCILSLRHIWLATVFIRFVQSLYLKGCFFIISVLLEFDIILKKDFKKSDYMLIN